MQRASNAAGLSLINVVVGIAVTSIIIAGLANFLGSSFSLTRVTSARARLDIEASRTLEKLVAEIRRASAGNLTPTNLPFTGSLTYQSAQGWANDTLVLGPVSVLEWQASPTDPVDGVDNDGNGLVDDGRVVKRVNPGLPGQRIEVLVAGVPALLEGESANLADDNGNGLNDEGGLCFDFTDGLKVHLSLQRLGPGGQVFTRTLQTSVAPRNG